MSRNSRLCRASGMACGGASFDNHIFAPSDGWIRKEGRHGRIRILCATPRPSTSRAPWAQTIYGPRPPLRTISISTPGTRPIEANRARKPCPASIETSLPRDPEGKCAKLEGAAAASSKAGMQSPFRYAKIASIERTHGIARESSPPHVVFALPKFLGQGERSCQCENRCGDAEK